MLKSFLILDCVSLKMLTVLGLGANVVTLLLILILTIMRRNDRCNRRVS